MLTCRIERHANAFMIRANDRLLPLYAYMTYQPAKGRYADFRSAGVKFASVAVYAGDRGINPASGSRPFRPGFMVAPGEYDFRWVDEDFRRATCGASPGDAYILSRLMLEMPTWWEELHPEAQCRDAAGTPSHCSFSSEVWIDAAVDAMEHFHAWLEESGWNEYVVGWHIAAGSTEEYIRPVLHPMQFLDYSEPSLRAYRCWLADRYPDASALNRAWSSGWTSFDEIPLPRPAARAYARHGGLRDPIAERSVLDFYAFHSDELALFVRRICAEGKRITRRAKLMGVFYGNVSICDTEHSHNSMELLLNCDDVDFFASPFCYTENRGRDCDWPFQATLESAALHGKPWFVEADVRTLLSRPISQCMPAANPAVNDAYEAPVWLGPETLEGSLSDMLRAFSRVLTHNAAIWWFDMWGGWYDHDALMAFQKWAFAFYDRTARAGGLSGRAQLAVFLDERALNSYDPDGRMASAASYGQFVELGWLGAPYDSYLFSDFERVDPSQYRTALLLSPAGLTDAQRAHLSKWKRDGRTVIFAGLTSFFDGELGEETEIACERADQTIRQTAVFSGIRYPNGDCCGPKVALLPGPMDVALAVNDEGETVAVLHRARDYQTLWSVVPQLPAKMVREAMLLSGAHIYAYGRENVFAGGDLVAIHACSDGVKRVYLPDMGRAYDVFTEERVPGTELWVELKMKAGETRLLRLELANQTSS